MRKRRSSRAILVAFSGVCALAQTSTPIEQRGRQPLYEVTVVSRTTKAINYGYLSAPTRIGFQGTAVAPAAHGTGKIAPERGSTNVELRFEDLPPAQRFGAQYLTYVVWAISPEGRAQNIGELILDGSDHGQLKASTPMQTFALIVTAEPYYAVARPSGVVVLENIVTRDTIGQVREVNATYELLPRQPYTYETSVHQTAAKGQEVSPEQYESILALYQALNAIQIAQSQGADDHARAQMARARELYNRARTFPVHLSKEIVSMAREATQIAEDSRAIAAKRSVEAAGERRTPAHNAPLPQPAVTERSTPQTRARIAPGSAAPGQTSAPALSVKARENRERLLAGLPHYFDVADTGRGITITVPEHAAFTPEAQTYYFATAAALKPYNGMRVSVEAHSDSPGSAAETNRTAAKVRESLIAAGIAAEAVSARGYGEARPAETREKSRRIEIILSGEAIGTP